MIENSEKEKSEGICTSRHVNESCLETDVYMCEKRAERVVHFAFTFECRTADCLAFSVFFARRALRIKWNENGHLRDVLPIQERFCPRKGLKCPYDLLLLKLIPCFETKYYAKPYLLRSVVEGWV